MLTTAQARDAILDAMPAFDTEVVPVNVATGRILRQAVSAERDQPPFDRVMMDGIAIRFGDFDGGARKFPIQSTQHAGDVQQTLNAGNCIEIMTGASLPKGSDCIIPVERLTVTDGSAVIEANYVAKEQQFIHAQASDHAKGAELLMPGARIAPMDIAVIASCGLTDIEVARSPIIRVISTGNELVPAGEPIGPQQIRMSNGPAIIAMLGQHGYTSCEHDHIRDDPALLEQRIGMHLDDADMLVLSGGVSMGKADYLPQVLAELGVAMVFHRISQRPGKPMWFGIGPTGQAVFALPGNPVSTLICGRQYVIPALNAACGLREAPPEFASLTQHVTFKPRLTCFLPVRSVSNVGGQVLAMPVHTNTSGDFASLSGTDGYIELPLEETDFPAGTAARLVRW